MTGSAPSPPSTSSNRSLHAAKATKQDEFYTQLSDIEKELKHYARHFEGRTVLCNCDAAGEASRNPRASNFFRYFLNNFEKLGLRRLVATCYKNDKDDDRKRGRFSRSTRERVELQRC